ncbi:MAG: F0F1 ATP synthase subunit epsilon [Vulcanimicrobiota bacterium]
MKRIVPTTGHGSFGILPRRRDCVAILSPGILVYEKLSGGEHYMAFDRGLLVKTGFQVTLSVRNAIKGHDLGQLHEAVEQGFLELDQQEADVRLVLAKLETSMLRRFAEFQR